MIKVLSRWVLNCVKNSPIPSVVDIYTKSLISDLMGHDTKIENKQSENEAAFLLQASCKWEGIGDREHSLQGISGDLVRYSVV